MDGNKLSRLLKHFIYMLQYTIRHGDVVKIARKIGDMIMLTNEKKRYKHEI